jgi:hypothetical protein
MKLAITGYDWFTVDGYPDEAFWKGYVQVGRKTLYGVLRRKVTS